ITNKGRAAGRSGLGAVMGSKKLKAIAVRGQQVVPLAHKSALQQARKKYLKQISSSAAGQALRQQGTNAYMPISLMIGDTPVKNWNMTGLETFPNANALSGETVNTLQQRKYGCWRCPIACGGLMKAGVEYNYPAGVHRPEYEAVGSFGTLCFNDNLESIIMASEICNRHGLDTISTGAAVAFAIECYENGLITDKDTDGIQLKWGNHQAIVAMTEKIAKREGFGNTLADGVKVAAEKIGKGAEEFAIHIHGQEVPMRDPKFEIGYTVAYLDATPARHTQGNVGMIGIPASGLELPPFDPQSYTGRAEAHKVASHLFHVMQCAGLCMFGYMSMDVNSVPKFLNLVTGWDYGIDDLLKIGERIANIRQAFNIREGISMRDFKMPNRVLGHPPLEAGPTAGREVDIETLLREYLAAMDWDPETGKPSRRKLLELGLKDVAEALWPQ
ncbi:MAG: aldehyde ferredoxin oxidoreductase, partial [Chloroflexi bacterium]|nr:aldehyde ferredoxin oxidoreductase [Chloroflexota bacterium]